MYTQRAAGVQRGASPTEWNSVNVGTVNVLALAPRRAGAWSTVETSRGGVLVVVRDRESRSHGEGGQRTAAKPEEGDDAE